MSRIGLKNITLPEKVSVKSDANGLVVVEGPKGKLEFTMPGGISLEEADGTVTVKRATEHRVQKALHGTSRSLISNMIEGVTKGFVKELEIQGVGFRAAVKGKAKGTATPKKAQDKADKAAKKNIIHGNSAARKKAQLARATKS